MLKVRARLQPRWPQAQHEDPALPTGLAGMESVQRQMHGKMLMEEKAPQVPL